MWTAASVIGLLLLFWSLPMGSLTIGIGTGGLMTVIFLREVL